MPSKEGKRTKDEDTEEVIEDEPIPKRKRSGIDMSHVPKSLLDEGFAEVNDPDTTVPDYLQCPVCREILVEPEMNSCGHTLCKICVMASKKSHLLSDCPVCKCAYSHPPVPNFVVKQILDKEYPELQKIRNQQLKDMQELSQRITSYPRSSRYRSLNDCFTRTMSEEMIQPVTKIIETLKKKSNLNPHPSDAEIEYYMAWKLNLRFQSEYRDVGQLIFYCPGEDVSVYIDWLEHHKSIEYTRWTPVLFFAIYRSTSYASLKKVADIHQLDIGQKISLDEWLNRPAFWLKGLDLGDIVELDRPRHICRGHHMLPFYIHSDSDQYDSDGSLSDDYE
ncbi:LON peptidase N-terminal domain and RING finger protein [Planoprotostelium fungivorum]|uniref:LON peptidase N-terminal domain and RING finger protein n=1 Tax=Planoprotostelium fungivorum TaxID=1890364 RepID=A0A2P6N6N7_9EUKA|nr:LON peptidase N-terminal domain and RING finger protein [Planoprotostelium fungivorum]